MDDNIFIKFDNVSRIYETSGVKCVANDNVSFTIKRGELCFILGPSGAGKTTILNLLGAMDKVTSGHIFVDGRELTAFSEKELKNYRRNTIGFVFQFYNLMPTLTTLENIEIVSEIAKNPMDPDLALEKVGLSDKAKNFPSHLSGGEQQRVAIARAIAKNPSLILADEPTGALDYETGKMILGLLAKQCREEGKTVIIITHNSALTAIADHIIRVRNGKIDKDYYQENPISADELEW